jgi:hypothetical protein
MEFVTDSLHIKQYRGREYRENRLSGNRTFLWA